jgi:N-acetylglucosaminyldiphosphoundecaprenol N-acetyl-beta-D-mannosaminyltransferase
MLDHGAATGARALWAVGALFEYYGGERPRAPLWMRRAGLEWAFRLALEPRRLAGRYLLGNAAFLLRARGRAR